MEATEEHLVYLKVYKYAYDSGFDPDESDEFAEYYLENIWDGFVLADLLKITEIREVFWDWRDYSLLYNPRGKNATI